MYLDLHTRFADTDAGQRARALTSACVHCGFCLETCPTYLDSRDERDSPRGRIYLIKQLLETGQAGASTQLHLDRCLTCRGCETTCPSGMAYGELLDIGRGLMETAAPRPLTARAQRRLLRLLFSRPRLVGALLALARPLRPLLPRSLAAKIPPRQSPGATPAQRHPRTMLVLEGCVQQAATPNTSAAAKRVLDRLGITLLSAPEAGCCGALDYHLAAHDTALERMRRNIDAWWPQLEDGAEAIISCASGCGVTVADYGELLADDPAYADKARIVSQRHRDIGELLLQENLAALAVDTGCGRVAVHTPCSLQHGLRRPSLIAQILARAGFELVETTDSHLCCGSAGSYSILHSAASDRLRDRALTGLKTNRPDLIATANIGCQLHLQGAAGTPVVHWIELLDDA